MTAIIIYLLISLALGAVSCFFGKKIFFTMLAATVFFNVFKAMLARGHDGVWPLVLAVAAGVLAALLAKFLYKTGVFLIGFVAGAGLGLLLCGFLPAGATTLRWVIVLAVAVVAGVCAIKWCNLFIMLATAYNGASLLAVPLLFFVVDIRRLLDFFVGEEATVSHLNSYLTGSFSTENAALILVVTILLAAAGFFYQWKSAHRR